MWLFLVSVVQVPYVSGFCFVTKVTLGPLYTSRKLVNVDVGVSVMYDGGVRPR